MNSQGSRNQYIPWYYCTGNEIRSGISRGSFMEKKWKLQGNVAASISLCMLMEKRPKLLDNLMAHPGMTSSRMDFIRLLPHFVRKVRLFLVGHIRSCIPRPGKEFDNWLL